MHGKRIAVLALVLVLAASVSARADKVDDFVQAQMQKQHIPGLSLAVVKEGKVVKAQGYGLANVELNAPARPDTVYKIGSISKQFIASGIVLLAEEEKLSVDDKISKFLDGSPETWQDITVRHLLTHTSGIVREAPGFDPLKVQTDAEVIKSAYPLPLRFAPGEKYEYCNVGYFTLAEIIHKVSGKPWAEYLNERLFAPLEMSATRATNMTDLVANRAGGYVWRNGKFQNARIYLAVRPSGAFLSSVLDLAKWDAALYTDGILKQHLRDQMWTPVTLTSGRAHPYGLGWQLDTVGGRKVVQHGGSLDGFRSALARFVDDKLTVVVLTNGDGADAGAIVLGVAAQYIPGLIPQRTAVKVEAAVLDAYAGEYRPNESTVLTLTREGDKLILAQGSAEKRELLPENETTFFNSENPRLTFRFAKDEDGNVTHLVLLREGREITRAEKVK